MRPIAPLLLLLLMCSGTASATVPGISNVTNADPMGYTARITWDTDIICDNRVKYSLNSDMSDSSWSDWENDTTSMLHIQLSNLQLNTTYYYQAFSYNALDSANSTVQNFESLPWIIRKNTSVVAMWDVNDSAMTGQIEYGLDTGYGNLTEIEGIGYWQYVEISDLVEGTTYHYRLKGSDYKGVAVDASCDMTFTTRTTLDLNNTIKAARIGGDMPKTYYVKESGNDALDGLSLANAWATPFYAAQVAEAGDTILVVDGTYSGYVGFGFAVDPVHHGIPEAPITMKAYSGTPTIAGQILIRANYITIDGLKVQMSIPDKNIDVCWNTGIKISNCDLYGSGGEGDGGDGIYFRDVTYSIIEDCNIYDAAWNGIGLKPYSWNPSASNHIIVRNIEMPNPKHNGFDAQGDYITVDNINISNTGRRLVSIANSEYWVFINSTLESPATDGIRLKYLLKDILVMNNTVQGMPLAYFDYAIKSVTNLIICDNYVSGYSLFGMEFIGGDNVLIEENEIHTDELDGYTYRFFNGGSATLRNENISPYKVRSEDGTTVTVEYTDGKVFTENGANAPKWYPDRSNYTFNSGTVTFTDYNITLKPTSGYLKDVTTNHESDVADDRTNISANSSVSSNPTTITATMQNSSNTYNVSVNGVYTTQVVSNSDKVATYQYASSWSPHTFEFDWFSDAGFSGAPDPTNIANTTGETWVRHSWSAGSGNVSDSYNVSVNSVWHNTTTNAYYNNTGLAAETWSNVTVWAYNNTGGISQNSISQNTQSDAAAWTPSNTAAYFNATSMITITTKIDGTNLFSRTPTEADGNATSGRMVVKT